MATDVPDPQAPETFWVSKLDWDEHERPEGQLLDAWYRSLAELRRQQPDFGPGVALREAGTAAGVSCSFSEDPSGRPEWFMVARGGWRTAANLSRAACAIPLEGANAEVVLAWGSTAVVERSTAGRDLARCPGGCRGGRYGWAGTCPGMRQGPSEYESEGP